MASEREIADFRRGLAGQLANVVCGNSTIPGAVEFILDLIGNTKIATVDAALAESIRQLRLDLGHTQYLLSLANAEIMAHRHAVDNGVTADMVQAAIDEYDNVYDGPECRQEAWMRAALEAAMRERDGSDAPATKSITSAGLPHGA